MKDPQFYEVVQRGTGWVLRRSDRTPLVEFPTRAQAVRAAIAVSRDEGLAHLLIHGPDGGVRRIETSGLSTIEV